MKLCECNCGFPAPISPVSHARMGYVRGMPRRFIRGHAMKGKHHTQEARKNIREHATTSFKKGHKSLTDGMNLLNYQKKEEHWNWKGGITPELTRIRGSAKYSTWRLSVYERDNFTCVFCGVRGGNLQADHIKPFAFYPELRFELTNGRTLCLDCHRKTPTYANRKDIYATT